MDTVAGPIELSSAQRHVLVALKRLGEASADELADTLSITPSAVRQHLGALRFLGCVASRHERGRPGRPADLYHVTEQGEAHFSSPSGDFSLELLGHLEEEAPDLIARVFERRRRRRVEDARQQLSGQSLDEKIAGVVRILEAEGYLVDFVRLEGDSYLLTLHSCAIWPVASRYGEACVTELEFLKEVLPEAAIERVAHKVAGGYVCGYEVGPPTRRRKIPLVQA